MPHARRASRIAADFLACLLSLAGRESPPALDVPAETIWIDHTAVWIGARAGVGSCAAPAATAAAEGS